MTTDEMLEMEEYKTATAYIEYTVVITGTFLCMNKDGEYGERTSTHEAKVVASLPFPVMIDVLSSSEQTKYATQIEEVKRAAVDGAKQSVKHDMDEKYPDESILAGIFHIEAISISRTEIQKEGEPIPDFSPTEEGYREIINRMDPLSELLNRRCPSTVH